MLDKDYKSVEVFYIKNIKIVNENIFEDISLRTLSAQFDANQFLELRVKQSLPTIIESNESSFDIENKSWTNA